MLFVVVVVVAAMMALWRWGEIGPLIAGDSVIGVAIGFGAQTFVRDVIAGMFYLLDDAFRVGEYIQSGNYKGTVEGFSIRSVRLRHQRGPLYTVPFGLLGAVQNMSRDWVIDKITLGVTYDTDLDLARKLIKQVGLDLTAEPEFAPLIIEPLKMQGVHAFGDFAIQLRAKMMTLPGEQFVIRRAAFARIKKHLMPMASNSPSRPCRSPATPTRRPPPSPRKRSASSNRRRPSRRNRTAKPLLSRGLLKETKGD